MTISVLQETPAESHGSLHSTQAVTQAGNTAGSSFHLGLTFDTSNGTTTATITSVPSMTWTRKGTQTDAADTERTTHYVADGAASGSITVTATFDVQTGHSAILLKEIGGTSGYDATADANASNQQATPGTGADGVTTTNTAALSAQPALISAFCMDSAGGGTPAAGTGFTSDGTGWSGFTGTALMRSESKRVASTAALAATFTAAANDTNQSFAAVFTETGGGAGPAQRAPLGRRYIGWTS